MNWGRAKTILIYLFLIIDISLVTVLFCINSSRISQDTISDCVEILKKHSVNLDKSLISNKKAENSELFVSNIFLKREEAAQMFLGNDYRLTEDNSLYCRYVSGSRILEISYEKVNFSDNRERVKLFAKDNKQFSELLSSKLKKSPFKDYEIIDERVEDGLYYVSIAPVYEKKCVNGVVLSLIADSNGIISADGTWYTATDCSTVTGKSADITAVLLELCSFSDIYGREISDIDYAYYMPKYLESKTATAILVYQIKTKDGGRYLFNARNGEYIEQ